MFFNAGDPVINKFTEMDYIVKAYKDWKLHSQVSKRVFNIIEGNVHHSRLGVIPLTNS